MTTTHSGAELVQSRTARPTAAAGRSRAPRADPVHRNTIAIVGDLLGPVEPRVRADGHEVLSFRVSVRLPVTEAGAAAAAGERRDAGAGPRRESTPPGRRDVLDCVVATPILRRRLEQYQPGDVVEVDGALRHRFWNASGRVQSRYEIDVQRLKRLARDRTSRAAPPADTAD